MRAAQAYAEDYAAGKVTDSLTEDMFSNYMYSAPAFQTRIFSFARAESTGFQTFCSGSAHTRSFIIPTPCGRDFTPQELDKAIEAYNSRDRRFGGVKP